MTTAERVAKIRQKNPCATLEEVGQRVGVTRERVRQLLKAQGLPTMSYRPSRLFECLNCGASFPNRQGPKYQPKYCSRSCAHEHRVITLACLQCGSLFKRRETYILPRSRYKNPGMFCSTDCYRMWRRGRSPEGATAPGVPRLGRRKWDWDVISTLVDNGWGGARIARHFGMSLGTAYAMVWKRRHGLM